MSSRSTLSFRLFLLAAILLVAGKAPAQTGGVYLDEHADAPSRAGSGPPSSTPGTGTQPRRTPEELFPTLGPGPAGTGAGEVLLPPATGSEAGEGTSPLVSPFPLILTEPELTKEERDRAWAQREIRRKQEALNKWIQREEARRAAELQAKAREGARNTIRKDVDQEILDFSRVLDGGGANNNTGPLKPDRPPSPGPQKGRPESPMPGPGRTPEPEDPDRPLTEKELKYQENLRKSRELYQTMKQRATAGGSQFTPAPIDPLRRLGEGWCQLFDGKTWFGWKVMQEEDSPYKGGRFYRPRTRPDVICCDPEKPGLLYTTSQFGNATVSLDYQCPDDAEVLLLLRSPPSPRDLHSSCYAIILNSATRQRGEILGRHAGTLVEAGATVDTGDDFGRLPDPSTDPPLDGTDPDGDDAGLPWRHAEVQCDGGMLRVKIDRNEPLQWYDVAPIGYGHIGLLVAKGPAKFRKIYWKPGASENLFDEIDLENWRYDPLGGDSIPRPLLSTKLVTRDTETKMPVLQLRGPAILENEREAKNFCLQLEYQVILPNGQAGVFFRAKPGDAKSGYECSIQNMPSVLDRRLTPVGVDTGAIRGLAGARSIELRDIRWNYLTINVIDRHIQTWVNGVPVCDWGDLRNPSSAKPGTAMQAHPFLDAGTIQLHARTPGTLIQFRNIRLSPFMPRFPESTAVDATTWTRETGERQRPK